MSAPLRIAWLVPEPGLRSRALAPLWRPAWDPDLALASVWIRSYQLAPYLAAYNYQVVCNQLEPLPQVAIFLRRYSTADLALARQLKAAGVKIVLDVIVNYFEARPDFPGGYGGISPQGVDDFLRLVELSDQVWTVSPFLQVLAGQRHPSAHFVSDSVDPRHFDASRYAERSRPADRAPLTLGWSGTAAKASALEALAPLLTSYIEAGQVQVAVIAQNRPVLSFPFQFHRWRYASFPRQIAACNLCLAPRGVDNDYDRGHSLFKIGVFMAMGVPALAGPVPSYDLLLGDGQAGRICATPAEWKLALGEYIHNAPLRAAARKKASENMQPFLSPNIAEQVHGLLRRLCP
ncbi:MAG: hypothetical protein AB1894_19185 [Chloroflexota bacterium]